MSQSIPSVTINLGNPRAGKLQNSTYGADSYSNRFFGIHTEYETEFAFSFKNSEVCGNGS